jgi:hypothetical protein
MNKRPKQMIVDRGELSSGLVDWAQLHGIDIVSRPPDRRDTVDGRVVHPAPGRTDCSLPVHCYRGDLKGRIERINLALESDFQKLRGYDK